MANLDRVFKRLPEDVVEYSIFPQIPNDLHADAIKRFLDKQIDDILAHLSDRIVNYIWQHESFNLKPVINISSQDSVPPHLHGSTNFGDNIDDEWFIVHLLYEITREFAGTVVRVNDNDEEFLLIECANALPKWLDPETAEKRVYVYNGDLHVIPIPQSPEEFASLPLFTPTLAEAVACVRDCTSDTRCNQSIQNLINKRLSKFPRKVTENIHYVNCFLPTPLAVLLSDQPSLVSAGVRTFYYREPLELKACRPMKHFKPDDLVRTRVKMTRCLYAQLAQQQFTPDKRSGWTVVSPSNPEFLERDIGVKLAHGFEILCSKYNDLDNSVVNGEHWDDSNQRWQHFKKSITSKGFFKGEIEGSKLYMKLLEEAKQFFKSQLIGEMGDDSIGKIIVQHIKRLAPKFDEFRKTEQNLLPSDDDSWMNITPEQVDDIMKSSGAFSPSDRTEMFDLNKVAESMTAFVEHESGLEGAEFPKESAEDGDNQFEGGGLIQAMQKIFDFPDEVDSSGSDMSEYDWSDGSDDELGSPTKMPTIMKKSSLSKQKGKKEKPKSVHFSHADSQSSKMDKPGQTVNSDRPSCPPPDRPSNIVVPELSTQPLDHPVRPPRSKTCSKPSTPPPPPPPSSSESKRDKKLEILMDAMDRELAATDVGKSFERMPKPEKPKRPPPPVPRGTTSSKKTKPKVTNRNIEDEDDDFQPVNIDLNVVKNTLESFKAQQGLPGPASNILAGFGIKLPQDKVNGKA
ncbi:protein SGT1 [Biomphalaria glabrata]|uniref:Uncharacterized protein n=1 Tax=Biomphalaria glabrata TaxID=6526 RepID=A0A2C9LQU2_BIOGL|nr:protein SGT1 [Biomphalaria glabrata]